MSKKFLYRFLMYLSVVVAAVLWLLSVVSEKQFGFFNLSWAVVLISLTFGTVYILNGLFSKVFAVTKKISIFIGAGFYLIGLFGLVSAITLPGNIIMPIIAIIVATGLLLGVVATGGKKWDEGDNHKVGYKNYHQRKAEEEKEKNKAK